MICTLLGALVVLVCTCNAAYASHEGVDCQHGCPSAWAPVCAADGNTYGNACLATCQQQRIQHNEPCSGDGMQDAWTHVRSSQDEVLPMGHLQRFAGFRYVARVQLRRPSPQHLQEDPHHTPGGRARRRYAQSVTDNPGQLPPSFLRVTREGHVYVSSGLPASDATPGSGAQQQAFEKQSEDATLRGAEAAEVGASTRRGRSLMAVFDGDQRSECPHLPTYPFSAIGMVLTMGSSSEALCSGALVGPDVVLTAAHCVFSRTSGAFLNSLDFSPGRYRSAYSDDIVSPFGSFPWVHVTVYSSFVNSSTLEPMIWDLAVIKLGVKVGYKTGWMGLQVPCLQAGAEKWQAFTAGYPLDKASGTCMSTQCYVIQEQCDANYLYHRCSAVPGQSGSPMWWWAINDQAGPTSSLRIAPFVRAVHNLEWTRLEAAGYVPYTNSGVALTPAHYAAIRAWIADSFGPEDPNILFPLYPQPFPAASTSSSLSVVSGPGVQTTQYTGASPSLSQPLGQAEVVGEAFWNLTRLLRRKR